MGKAERAHQQPLPVDCNLMGTGVALCPSYVGKITSNLFSPIDIDFRRSVK